MSSRMSDDERALFMCLLFPPLWPLGIAVLIQWAVEGAAQKWNDWRERRKKKHSTRESQA